MSGATNKEEFGLSVGFGGHGKKPPSSEPSNRIPRGCKGRVSAQRAKAHHNPVQHANAKWRLADAPRAGRYQYRGSSRIKNLDVRVDELKLRMVVIFLKPPRRQRSAHRRGNNLGDAQDTECSSRSTRPWRTSHGLRGERENHDAASIGPYQIYIS